MSTPLSSPSLDQYGKPIYQPVGVQVNTLSRGQSAYKPVYPVISLWKEQFLALLTGAVIFTLGALGLCAFFSRGPLYDMHIPLDSFRGPIVNSSNAGALIAAVATLFTSIGRKVLSGVARAWLRRRAVGGYGPTIRQWKTLAAGVSIRDARRTPLLAGGLLIIFTLALGVQTSALVGVALPNVKDFFYTSQYTSVVPLSGNAGTGQLKDCLAVDGTPCAQWLLINNILDAYSYGAQPSSQSSYQISRTNIGSESGFIGGAFPTAPTGVFKLFTWVTPMTRFTTTCSRINDEGADTRSYYVTTACLGRQNYGNRTRTNGTYTYGDICTNPDGSGVIVSLAIGGWALRASGSTYAVRCNVAAEEGIGGGIYGYGTAAILSPHSGFQKLPSNDLYYIGTALIAGLRADAGLDGVATQTHSSMLRAVGSNSPLTIFGNSVSNAFAASSSAAYTILAGGGPLKSDGTSLYTYRGMIPRLDTAYTREGYGWASTSRVLGWSVLCLAIGLIWFVLALYMVGGGTRYDPTDWYQTVNTSAGSNLTQTSGTCTGAYLRARSVNRERLWYGELYAGHVGFSQGPAAPLQPKLKYGEGV